MFTHTAEVKLAYKSLSLNSLVEDVPTDSSIHRTQWIIQQIKISLTINCPGIKTGKFKVNIRYIYVSFMESRTHSTLRLGTYAYFQYCIMQTIDPYNLQYCKLGSTVTHLLHLPYECSYLSIPLLLFLEQHYPFKQNCHMNIFTHWTTTVGTNNNFMYCHL